MHEGANVSYFLFPFCPQIGDKTLAQSAQMYHYQHQKQQMLSVGRYVFFYLSLPLFPLFPVFMSSYIQPLPLTLSALCLNLSPTPTVTNLNRKSLNTRSHLMRKK